MDSLADALKALGLDKAPEPRYKVSDPHTVPSGSQLLNHKKALKLVDPIESAAFMRFVPPDVHIDQELDARVFHGSYSRACIIRTDKPVPTGPIIEKVLGISGEMTAENHYKYLWTEIRRYYAGMGAIAMSPVLITRTSGADGTIPILAASFKLDIRAEDGGTLEDQAASFALLGPRAPEVHLEDGETLEDVV